MAAATVTRVIEPAYLAAVRESYDTVADAYVQRVPPPERLEPMDRAMFAAFAEIVRESGLGPVADLGCGPGRITAYLVSLGVSAFGVDVSPKMIENARGLFPDLDFHVGSMTALNIPDDSLGGILAFFSTHHTPPELLPVVFGEFGRTLRRGGHLLLGTHLGHGEHVRAKQGYGGLPLSYESHLLPVERIVELLAESGLTVVARLLQHGEKRDYATLLARSEPALAAEDDVQNGGQDDDQR